MASKCITIQLYGISDHWFVSSAEISRLMFRMRMSMPPSQCAAAATAAEIPSELEKYPTILWPCRMIGTCLLMDKSWMTSMLSWSAQGGAQQAKHAEHGETVRSSQESEQSSGT